MALFDFGLAKLRARTQLSRDIDAMSQDELDGLGLTRDSMRAVAFLPEGRKARMTEMAALHGLALDEVTDPRVVSEVSLRCAHCRLRNLRSGNCREGLSHRAVPI